MHGKLVRLSDNLVIPAGQTVQLYASDFTRMLDDATSVYCVVSSNRSDSRATLRYPESVRATELFGKTILGSNSLITAIIRSPFVVEATAGALSTTLSVDAILTDHISQLVG